MEPGTWRESCIAGAGLLGGTRPEYIRPIAASERERLRACLSFSRVFFFLRLRATPSRSAVSQKWRPGRCDSRMRSGLGESTTRREPIVGTVREAGRRVRGFSSRVSSPREIRCLFGEPGSSRRSRTSSPTEKKKEIHGSMMTHPRLFASQLRLSTNLTSSRRQIAIA